MIFSKIRKRGLAIIATAILCSLVILGVTQTKGKKEISLEHSPKELPEGNLLNEDPWKEINKIAERYINNNISLSGTLKLYDYETSAFMEEQKFSYTRFEGNIQSNLGEIQSISNTDYTISIDNADKIILVSNTDKKISGVFDPEKLKLLMSGAGATAKVFSKSAQRILLVENINYEDIVNYKIYYDPLTYKIDKVVLEMSTEADLKDHSTESTAPEKEIAEDIRQPEEIDTSANDLALLSFKSDYVLEVTYTNENNLPAPGDRVEKYITVKNQNIYLADAYKEYELVDQVKKPTAVK